MSLARHFFHKDANCRVLVIGDTLELTPVAPNLRDPPLMMESSFVFGPYLAHCFRLVSVGQFAPLKTQTATTCVIDLAAASYRRH